MYFFKLIYIHCINLLICKIKLKCTLYCYRFTSSSDVPNVVSGGGFFSWGTKFKYSGRVEREILEDMSITRESPSVTRVGSLRRKSSSEPPTPSNVVLNQAGIYKELIFNFYV